MAERPLQQGTVYGVTAAPEEAIALADMMQLQLGQKETDVIDQLTNTDFEGKFFTIGDTVKVVAIDPNSIKVVEGDKNDVRPTLDKLAFAERTMVIDKKREFAFQIKDLERVEGKWNKESAAHALAARKMRNANCMDILNLITASGNVARIGSKASPALDLTQQADPGKALFRLTNAMLEYLHQTGAVDGKEYTYGANKTVPLRGTVSMFCAPGIHRTLLDSQYTRVDDVTEDVIRNGKYDKFNGMLLNSAPALDSDYAVHVDAIDGATNIGIIIIGTKNTVTRAGKVLPPEKMRDYVHFADNYYGREIYGRMIACAEACIIAFVKYDNEFTIVAPTNEALFINYKEQAPTEANDAAGRFLPNEGYANSEGVAAADVTGLATVATSGAYSDLSGTPTLGTAAAHAATDFATGTHVHTFDVTGDAETGVETGAPTEPTPDQPGD